MLKSYTFLGELARISATFLGELAMKSATFLGELAKIRAIGFLNYFEAVQEILARHYLWRHQKISTHHTHHSMGSIIPIPLINLPHIKVGIYWRPVGIFTFAKHSFCGLVANLINYLERKNKIIYMHQNLVNKINRHICIGIIYRDPVLVIDRKIIKIPDNKWLANPFIIDASA